MTDQTLYHASVKDFRTSLVKASTMFEQMSNEHQEPIMRASALARETGDASHRDKVPAAVRDAYQGSLMAYSYGYTLGAVIRFAEQRFGEDVALELACRADDLLTNGDDDDLNGDIELETQDA